jgi:molybdate transport system substrate-binding protein
MTEIRHFEAKGLTLVGPLPAEIQNYTSYEAALMTGATAAEGAGAVLRHLATPAAKAAFTAGGVE